MPAYPAIKRTDVNIVDIADTLVMNGGTADRNNPHTFFTKEANINKWAKYKPFVYPAPVVTDAERALMSYGISDIPYWGTLNNMRSGMFNNVVPMNMPEPKDEYWVYKLPKGGREEPLRLSDFCGYYPKAVGPVGKLLNTEYTIDTSGRLLMSFNNTGGGDNSISLYDITLLELDGTEHIKLSDMYLGICLYNGTVAYFMTLSDKIKDVSNGTFSITENASKLIGNSWQVFSFASSIVIASLSSYNMTGTFAPLPSSLSTCKITQAGSSRPTTDVSSKVNYVNWQNTSRVEWSFTVTNSSSVIFNTGPVDLVEYDSKGTKISTIQILGSTSIGAKESKTFTGVAKAVGAVSVKLVFVDNDWLSTGIFGIRDSQ